MNELIRGTAIILLIIMPLLLLLIWVSYKSGSPVRSAGQTKLWQKRNQSRTFIPDLDTKAYIELTNLDTGKRIWKEFNGRVYLGRTRKESPKKDEMYIGTSHTISRRQCDVVKTGQGMVIRNISQVNITRLNGRPLHYPQMLKYGDRIEVGSRRYIVSSVGKQEY